MKYLLTLLTLLTLLRYLLAHGAEPSARVLSATGQSPLSLCLSNPHMPAAVRVNIIKCLLEAQADVNLTYRPVTEPICMSSETHIQNTETERDTEGLERKEINMDQDDLGGVGAGAGAGLTTPLIHAIVNKKTSLILTLLRGHASLTATDSQGHRNP